MFKKSDKVTIFGNWDRKGEVFFRHCVVYSCGKKQMILADAETGEVVGRHFKPVKAEGVEFGVRPAMSDEEAAALCLEIAAAFLVRERAHLEDCIARNAGEGGYVRAMQASIAALHAPSFVKKTAKTGGREHYSAFY